MIYGKTFKKIIEGHGGIGSNNIGTGGYGGIRYGMNPVYLDSYYDYDYYPSMQAYPPLAYPQAYPPLTYPPAAVYYPPSPPYATSYGQGYGYGYVIPPPNYYPYY